MEPEEQKLRKLEMKIVNSHGSLSLGLFSTAAWLYIVAKDSRWSWIGLTVVAAFLFLSSFYFFFIHKGNRQKCIKFASFIKISYVAWFLGLVSLGVGLIQTRLNWAAIPGLICIGAGYAVLIYGIEKAVKEAIKQRNPRSV